RDRTVTGVQTCALPILGERSECGNGCLIPCARPRGAGFLRTGAVGCIQLLFPLARGHGVVSGDSRGWAVSRPRKTARRGILRARSEERRVGNECGERRR